MNNSIIEQLIYLNDKLSKISDDTINNETLLKSNILQVCYEHKLTYEELLEIINNYLKGGKDE